MQIDFAQQTQARLGNPLEAHARRTAAGLPLGQMGRLRLVWDAETSERSRNLAFEMLSALSVALFIVTGDGELRLTNAAAERLARANRGIAACHGRLVLSDAKLHAQLREAIRRATCPAAADARETLVLHAPGCLPLSLLAMPLPVAAPEAGKAEALAAVFAGGPAPRSEPPMDLVRAVYGLTPAETRVLFAIVGGWQPSHYARAMGLSRNTVQTQLKALFAKMGCRSQADLVRRVLSDPMPRLDRSCIASQSDHPNR